MLAQASLSNVAKRDPYQRTHKMDFVPAARQPHASSYDWAAAFCESQGLPTNLAVNVSEPDFHTKTVNRLIEETPLETWKTTWLRWHTWPMTALNICRSSFYDAVGSASSAACSRALKKQQPRWKVCVASTDSTLGEALGRLYVEKYFPVEAQRRMRELVGNLRAALEMNCNRPHGSQPPETRQCLA